MTLVPLDESFSPIFRCLCRRSSNYTSRRTRSSDGRGDDPTDRRVRSLARSRGEHPSDCEPRGRKDAVVSSSDLCDFAPRRKKEEKARKHRAVASSGFILRVFWCIGLELGHFELVNRTGSTIIKLRLGKAEVLLLLLLWSAECVCEREPLLHSFPSQVRRTCSLFHNLRQQHPTERDAEVYTGLVDRSAVPGCD